MSNPVLDITEKQYLTLKGIDVSKIFSNKDLMNARVTAVSVESIPN